MHTVRVSQIVAHHADPVRLPLADGPVAALDATPPPGVPRRGTALLVPGYTGSKEDFAPILDPLAAAGYRVVAMDQPGQYASPGPEEPARVHAGVARLDRLGRREAARRRSGAPARPLVRRAGEPGGGAERARSYRSLTLLGSGPAAIGGSRKDRMTALEPFLARGMGAVYQAVEQLAQADPQVAPRLARAQGVPARAVRRLVSRRPQGDGRHAAHRSRPGGRTRRGRAPAAGLPRRRGRRVAAGDPGRDGRAGWAPGTRSIEQAVHSPAIENPPATVDALISFWREADKIVRVSSGAIADRPLPSLPRVNAGAAMTISKLGLYGPESVTWRLHADPLLAVGALRALLPPGATPGGDVRRGRALGIPRRPVGPAAAHGRVHRRDHLRHRPRTRPGSAAPGARRPPARSPPPNPDTGAVCTGSTSPNCCSGCTAARSTRSSARCAARRRSGSPTREADRYVAEQVRGPPGWSASTPTVTAVPQSVAELADVLRAAAAAAVRQPPRRTRRPGSLLEPADAVVGPAGHARDPELGRARQPEFLPAARLGPAALQPSARDAHRPTRAPPPVCARSGSRCSRCRRRCARDRTSRTPEHGWPGSRSAAWTCSAAPPDRTPCRPRTGSNAPPAPDLHPLPPRRRRQPRPRLAPPASLRRFGRHFRCYDPEDVAQMHREHRTPREHRLNAG